jgi:hypothetical protein
LTVLANNFGGRPRLAIREIARHPPLFSEIVGWCGATTLLETAVKQNVYLGEYSLDWLILATFFKIIKST